MKKNVRTANNSSLKLRREHIRLLTPAALELAVGGKGMTTIISETCDPVSVKNQRECA